ncbi:MAG: hypothetical protein Q9168_005721, partial [Polycauliona sp. 1 TL-2023]
KSKPHPTKKQRRPSKKLITTLESLAAALPDALPPSSRGQDQVTETGIAKIRHRSLKSKPGAMKKKEKVIASEKERFNRNMARMASGVPKTDGGEGGVEIAGEGLGEVNGGDGKSMSKWAVLRRHIQETMEQRPMI